VAAVRTVVPLAVGIIADGAANALTAAVSAAASTSFIPHNSVSPESRGEA
jgi:hypothetical protein